MRKYLPIIGFIFLVTFIILLSPIFKMNIKQPNYFKQDFENAKVVEVVSEEIDEDPTFDGRYLGTQVVKIKILTGKYKGKIFEVKNPLSRSHNVYVQADNTVIASIDDSLEEANVWIYNYKRENILYVLVGLLFILLILLGGMQGVYSIVSLIFTGIMIIFFMLPLIFQGNNPIIVTILTASIIIIVSFLLISGFNLKTLTVILGTIIGVIIAGVISYVSGNLAHLSGITMDKGKELVYVAQDYKIQVSGLMFSAILIASLGAVMDVAMSITSSIFEIHQTNRGLSKKQLFKSGMNIGKDVMGTMSNTLILAFAGSSLNSIMLIWGYQMGSRQFMNIPFIGTEIIQGLSGSIGIVLTVPITAIISVMVLKRKAVVGNKGRAKKKNKR
ncbi:YibE/F family protein [Vallitalea sediminicola]